MSESGSEAKTYIEKLIGGFSEVPNLRFVFPTAKPIKFSPFPWNGQVSNTWYDINAFRLNAVENTQQVEEAGEYLRRIVDEQIQSGVPSHRICRLLTTSKGFSRQLPPIYFSIGTLDPLVRVSWVESTVKLFRSAGIPTSLKVMSGTTHMLTKSAIEGLFKFIELTIT
ncbi:unnamed protein product [Nezara viridula]|uniref:palmitoyl-protein hydrolase n=1 Tax=Nezara viridula TaxID=85310 RepID=A0A9P0MMC5_NEZVI|nr:unnamed protein product [Nezara viridula]